jgi:hypothetical protein
MINVVCVLRSGGKVGYDASWVEKLQRGVSRNLTIPHKFICLSDCAVPYDRVALDDIDKGFWSKMQLFKPGLFDGPVMYLDLDTVICSNIDHIVGKLQDQKFVMWHESDNGIHSSAFMWWHGDYSYLWDLYRTQDFNYWKSKYSMPPLYGDQALISENTNHTLLTDHCPKEWFCIASSKHTTNSPNVKLLMFRKTSQKPSTMLDHPLVQSHWV